MGCPGRIVVVYAGAGPDTAAAELTRRLRGRGFLVDRLNLLDVLPRRLEGACTAVDRGILRRGRDALFALTSRSRLSVSALRALLRPVRRRMRRAIPPDARAVVTTSPVANQLLGPLRRRGRLAVPVITYVTDVDVHPLWLSPGVDAVTTRHAPPAGTTAASRTDPTRLVAEAAARSGTAGGDDRPRRSLLDSLGDAVAVVAALLQSSGGPGTGGG